MSLKRISVGPVAHGGTCVAHVDGKVTFVRGALPGEVVDVEITSSTTKISRAKVVHVVEPSVYRVKPDCPNAADCGGCDWLHTTPEYSTTLKTQVLADQLRRLAGIDWAGQVESVLPVRGWRSRMRYQEVDGVVGLHGHRSHEVVALPEQGCLVADHRISRPTQGGIAVAAASGVVFGDPGELITERAAGRDWRLQAGGFWQVHPAAADLLVDTVLGMLNPRPGEAALDLFCGVGLFAGALIDAGCSAVGIEGNRQAVAAARRNVPGARFFAGDVADILAKQRNRADLVVLDPPRAGAKRQVLELVTRLRPRSIVYVACDPASMARDLSYAEGYRVREIRAFDLFPGTQHFETVAHLVRVS